MVLDSIHNAGMLCDDSDWQAAPQLPPTAVSTKRSTRGQAPKHHDEYISLNEKGILIY